MKRLEDAFWREMESAEPEEQDLVIDLDSQIEFTGTFSPSHSLGFFTDHHGRRKVLIEWVLISKFNEHQSDDERIGKILVFAKILRLHKPKNFRVLDCLGFIPAKADSDHQGFGFVYAFPSETNSANMTEPVTLRQLLDDKSFSVTLEDKFSIAKSLTSSIYELHCHGWLHKNIRSQNVIFFDRATTDSTTKASSRLDTTPYLIGFYHSRPDSQVFYSESIPSQDKTCQLYQHPEYKHDVNRFQKKYDYYSIGIILLEVASWKQIEVLRDSEVRQAKKKGKSFEDDGFREILIARYAPWLAEVMGSAYKDAVMACLKGDFLDFDTGADEKNELDRFYFAVAARLAACSVV
jgi:serine/threonine protein kinase